MSDEQPEDPYVQEPDADTEAEPGAIDPARLWAVYRWCQRRAEQTVERCRQMIPYRIKKIAQEDVRCELGFTVDEDRAARRWLTQAADAMRDSDNTPWLQQKVREVAELHVRRVIDFGVLRREGLGYPEIREQLDVSERDLDLIAVWWRDAWSATGPNA